MIWAFFACAMSGTLKKKKYLNILATISGKTVFYTCLWKISDFLFLNNIFMVIFEAQ